MFHVKQKNDMATKPLYNRYGLKSDGYKTSTDYTKLKALLNQGVEVVCFVNYDIFPTTQYLFQDICVAKKINQCYQFDARGISYLTWYEDYNFTFEEMCEANGVKFIEPTNPNQNAKLV